MRRTRRRSSAALARGRRFRQQLLTFSRRWHFDSGSPSQVAAG